MMSKLIEIKRKSSIKSGLNESIRFIIPELKIQSK